MTPEAGSRRARRRTVLRTMARTGLTVTCLLSLYYSLPLRRDFTPLTVFLMTAAMVVLGWIIAWHARSITRSSHPRLRAVEGLASSLTLFLMLFALSYYVMGRTTEEAFSEPLTRTDALYFTVTCFSSVGFGDITPRSETARILTMIQMFGNLIFLGLVARILLGAVQRGLDRRDHE